MAVFWTIQARRHLRQALARALGRESDEANAGTGVGKAAGKRSGLCLNVLDATMERLNDILAATFPGMSVVVKDQVLGYRRKKDLFILMVESFGKDDTQEDRSVRGQDRAGVPDQERDPRLELLPSAGPEARPGLSRPAGRGATRRRRRSVDEPGLWRRAAVPRRDGHRPLRGGGARVHPQRLPAPPVDRFRDHRAIRAHRTLALQPGIRGRPGPARLHASDLPKLENALQRWETEPSCQAARRDVNALAASGVERFLDPIDYLRYVQAYVPWKDVKPDGTTETPSPTEIAEASAAREPAPPRRDRPGTRGCSAAAPTATCTAATSWSGSSATRRCGRPSSTTRTWARPT